jgi:hypothetical protein
VSRRMWSCPIMPVPMTPTFKVMTVSFLVSLLTCPWSPTREPVPPAGAA